MGCRSNPGFISFVRCGSFYDFWKDGFMSEQEEFEKIQAEVQAMTPLERRSIILQTLPKLILKYNEYVTKKDITPEAALKKIVELAETLTAK